MEIWNLYFILCNLLKVLKVVLAIDVTKICDILFLWKLIGWAFCAWTLCYEVVEAVYVRKWFSTL